MINSFNSEKNITTPDKLEEDKVHEQSLRPVSFDDFVGQSDIINNLKIYIQASHKRDDALDHVLLFGPPGLGKTTLANIISKELKVNIILLILKVVFYLELQFIFGQLYQQVMRKLLLEHHQKTLFQNHDKIP